MWLILLVHHAVLEVALVAVSGIEEQLRRFMPQTGVFQDVSVRLTSAYSKTTLTVEPRW